MKDQHSIQLIYYAVTLSSFWIIEALNARGQIKSKFKHSRTNFGFILTALPIQLTMIMLILKVSKWTNQHHWGLIYKIPFHHNPWVYFATLFILLDLCEYLYHVVMHKISLLWKVHLVHHSDRDVDVSTTTREHPVETLVRTGFLTLWVFLLGPVPAVLIMRQTAQTFVNITSHSRIRLPRKLDRLIGWVFITPNLHHVHHHYLLPFTDRNYGDVLSIWDRLFGTYAELSEEKTIFGLDTHINQADNNHFFSILVEPFRK